MLKDFGDFAIDPASIESVTKQDLEDPRVEAPSYYLLINTRSGKQLSIYRASREQRDQDYAELVSA